MIAIIDYDAGNTKSVKNALDRIGAEYVLTDDADVIRSADRVIFPGVGHAQAAMDSLRDRGLDTIIPTLTQPVLGICVGMQLLCASSEEGGAECLRIIPLRVRKFDPAAGQKVPHMGWNDVRFDRECGLFDGLSESDYCYYVHSYYVPDSKYSIATTDYGLTYAAAVQRDNFYGVQFHTEKSGAVGARILQNFIKI